jgi:hypothetical protein
MEFTGTLTDVAWNCPFIRLAVGGARLFSS